MVELAADGFQTHTYQFDERRASNPADFEYLHGYLDEWLDHSGIEDTGGDFGLYMRVVSHIVTEYMENPDDGILAYETPGDPDFRPRHIKGVVNWALQGSRSLDPEYYRFMAFSQLRNPNVTPHPLGEGWRA